MDEEERSSQAADRREWRDVWLVGVADIGGEDGGRGWKGRRKLAAKWPRTNSKNKSPRAATSTLDRSTLATEGCTRPSRVLASDN